MNHRIIAILIGVGIIAAVVGGVVYLESREAGPAMGNPSSLKQTVPAPGNDEGSRSAAFRVHADKGYYKDELTPERIFRGVLGETGKEITNYPLYRDFYLRQDTGRVIPLGRRDTVDMVLGSLLGHYVEVRGKLVDRTAGGGRVELWVGYIALVSPPSE